MTLGPGEKPLFMQTDQPDETYPGLVESPTFDEELMPAPPPQQAALGADAPSEGYITRYREVARLHALALTNNQIARILNYTPVRISIILRDPFVQAEIAKYRAKLFDSDAVDRMKDVVRDGTRRLHEIVLDPDAKDTSIIAATSLAYDRAYGKSTQEIRHESGTFMHFMELLKDFRPGPGASHPGAVDVTPQLPAAEAPAADTQADRWTTWIKTNITPA